MIIWLRSQMKKVLIVTDSFKESLSSDQVAAAIIEGFSDQRDYQFEAVGLADGGEGTMELITKSLNGQMLTVQTRDPLGRNIESKFGYSPNSKTAIIDVATSSGIELLSEAEKNPFNVSSYGTGQLIKAALEHRVETIILGLGSSATVDLGFGMLSALGYRFLDDDQKLVEITGGTLAKITDIDLTNVDPRLRSVSFKVACDVDNVLTGSAGSCYTFAKQKGANPDQIEHLEKQFIRLNQLINEKTGIDLNLVKGSGAAGGIGGAAHAFLGGELVSGSDLIVKLNDIENKVMNSDLIITGEGRFDRQSLHGKGPIEIVNLAQKYNKQVILICGSVDNQIYRAPELSSVPIFATITKVDSLENTLADAYANIRHTAQAISNLL